PSSGKAVRWHAPPSATTWSTTMPTRRGSSSRRSMPRSPTGNASATSSGSEDQITATHDVINPATESIVTTVELLDREGTDTAVLTPVEPTPLTASRLAELALEAGIPEDVFQVLPGKGSVVGQRFVEHPDVAKIVFTGSTEVGRQVMAGCAARIKPVTLVLGGKSANVDFADADLEAAAAGAPYAVFDNAG